jgi:hypothetical protein
MDPATPAPQAPKTEKSPKKFAAPKLALPKTFLVWAGIGALVVGFIIVVAFLSTQPWKGASSTPTPSASATVTPSPTPSPAPTISAVTPVTDEGVTWLSSPEKLGDLKLVKDNTADDYSPEEQPTYYKVGTDNDRDIVIANVPFPGMGTYYSRALFVKNANGKYDILYEHSSDMITEGRNEWVLTNEVSYSKTKKVYESISYQRKLTVNGVELTAQSESTSWFPDEVKTYQQPDSSAKLTKYASSTYGDVYLWASTRELGGYTVQSYMLRRPNSETITYQLRPAFMNDDDVPQVTWVDGSTNKDTYRTDGGLSCGSPTGISVINAASVKNLKESGKTSKNEAVYDFTTTGDPVVKTMYDIYALDYSDASGKKYRSDVISIAEYVKRHGVFAYKDALNRYILFTSTVYGAQAECGKPVVYLYPSKPTKVSVKVDAKITVSDPEYGKGWNVTAHPDGTLYLANGQKYDSLFWEGTGKEYPAITSGFIVPRAEVEATLKDHLAKLGMNGKESADFMEFWLPKMPNTPYVRLTWFGTREMDRLAPLTVTPKPDSVIRIFLDFEGLQDKISLPTQRLTTIARKGFTVTEWGGLLRK